MRILSIDPGMKRLGYSTIEFTSSDDLSLISYGMIHIPRTDEKFNPYLNLAIEKITNDFPRILDASEPAFIVSEIVPVGRLGSNSELVVAAITVCKTIAFQWGIEWRDIAANTSKVKVTGDGRASKAKIKNAVFGYFPELEARHKEIRTKEKTDGDKVVGIPQDQIDAIAIGIAGTIIYGAEPEAKK